MKLKSKLYNIIFESDTRSGKNFDLTLLVLIAISVVIVLLDSVPQLHDEYGTYFWYAEVVLTIIFSVEYVLRIYISPSRRTYIFSFWGIIDLLSVLPTYISLAFAGYHYLIVVRIFRLLRVFRILRMVRFNRGAALIVDALKASFYKVMVFLMTVFLLTILLGTLMYVIEGGKEGFTSIPQSVYWSIVTITTVGYGDVVPSTVLGKMLSSFIMLLGYAIIAVPTGIVSVELGRAARHKTCENCHASVPIHSYYCSNCGNKMELQEEMENQLDKKSN
jgi:voltage-gated potassium channel